VTKRAIELGNGHVDILINNAGIYPFGPTHEMTEEQFDRVFSLNVKVPYFLVAELAPLMAKRGKGAIVNLSTMVSDYGVPGMSLYGSSKAAVRATTGRALMHTPLPKRTEGDDPKRAAFVNRLVHERRIFGGALGPSLKVIRF
jgi:NAD(P)-dependent dehydrogenase (short-subunit alcohol dehydrogenase family)